MFGTLVCSLFTGILPFGLTSTPAASSPIPRVHTSRPTARSTVSNSSASVVPSVRVHVTLFLSPACSMEVGTPWTNGMPLCSINVLICPAICWSNPRSGIERIITFVSSPTPWMKPAHSSATYDAPTTSVFPGLVRMEKRSSEVIASSRAPGMSGYLGRPPIASTTRSAVSTDRFPFLSTVSMVCASTSVAYALRYFTLCDMRSAR
mmetsp:Transcript_48283/g.119603  ORF Transcript_48283/g.119603 Transcript_48283/m.119603 type:complete len:206 (-) Transcript_48283:382-999(-)